MSKNKTKPSKYVYQSESESGSESEDSCSTDYEEEIEDSTSDNENSEQESNESSEDESESNKETMLKKYRKTTKKKNLKRIIYKQIDEIFAIGTYNDFDVVIMKGNLYINATKLCKTAKKEFFHWLENKNSTTLISVFSKSLGMPRDRLVIKITTGPNATRGSYVHPDLVPHIAAWASPEYAILVSAVMNDYAVKARENELYELECKLAKKEGKINTLNDKIDTLLQDNKKTRKQLNSIQQTADELYVQNDELLEIVGDKSEDSVMKTSNPKNNPAFVVIKNTEATDKFKYYVIRTKNRSLNASIKRYKKIHPKSKIILSIDYNPNAINLWDRVKEQLRNKVIVRVCKLSLRKGYTEKKLIRDINRINEERYDVDI